MEFTREHFPAIIFYNSIDELKSLFGDEAPSYSTVKTGLMNSIVDDDR